MQKFAMHMNQWKSMGKNINRQTNNISVCVCGGGVWIIPLRYAQLYMNKFHLLFTINA